MARSAPWQRWPTVVAAIAAVSSVWIGSARADPVAGDYFVHSLPGQPEGPLLKMHAGHIEITPEHNGNLFFWHFQNKHIANRQRTVIWLNGGPGCSSEDGALMEIGPYRLKDDHTLEYNDGAWNEFANVMFVDNPVGTGFSYVNTDSYVHELDEMADQFIVFLEKWFALFPEYEHDDLYLAGESFAGQYIPYIAKHIVERNKNASETHAWALKGLLIGNGWISPAEQYESYIDFAYDKKLVTKGSSDSDRLENQRRVCDKMLAAAGGPENQPVDIGECESILQELLRVTRRNSGDDKDCINMYDVRLRDTYPSCGMNWPPDLPNLTGYLRNNDVIAALHINPNKNTGWQECNGNVGSQFRDRVSKPSIAILPGLLAEMPIVLFSGAEDLICNHLGTEAMIGNMAWNGGKGFELSPGNWAPRREWTFEGKDAGFWQEARNLTYVLFYNSSHMVPFDYPRRTRDMLDRFMGVDISSIGGKPTDSRLDGEPGPTTTVGGAAGNGNSTTGQDGDKAKVDAAKWAAYRKSGEIVLVIVAAAATAWGYFVWRDRRRRAGYRGVAGGPVSSSDTHIPEYRRRNSMSVQSGTALENFRNKRSNRDLEAGDFDEGELDDLHVTTPALDSRYSIGADSEDEAEGSDGNTEARRTADHEGGVQKAK
ncbi:pheromone processing carboxypeptidase kex1 [Grosmannia clavigera kw1407]|uniref:Pheromone-processing carboxypeptidase KEX1 n=1 Tax=Grosmannia clavigera (strain kw1407 / UAMH 11150) TaxID=655863 RepID=F0XGT0_GROCL|nr:pheromone processing carboxypeptidase kex1 [Grosmannia clavigera kw1407]EFX03291.1 pheromone processing carboxypeptidase kex1 [Grosmannia clavigera kw1407]